MDDFESDLEHQLSSLARVPLAEPEPVGELRHRARRVRAGRALTSAVAMTAAVAVVVALVVVSRSGSSATHPQKLQVAAPDFVLGDIDAVVLSSSFDADGARKPVPTSLAATVARIPGVRSVSGVLDTFAPLLTTFSNPNNFSEGITTGQPPRTPILFSYHEGEALHLTAGRYPVNPDEIIVDADVLSRYSDKLGHKVQLNVRGRQTPFTIVGVFDLPGVDLTGIPLAALSVAHQPAQELVDRLDVNLAPAADPINVRLAIAAAIGNDFTVATPSAISFPDQRLAQLEIQEAYWALLSPNAAERSKSGNSAPSDQEKANYEKYRDLATHVELRVENVSFLSPDAASLTFRIYYGGAPSSIIDQPQTGTATRVNGHWQLGKSTVCSLAALVGIKCDGVRNVTITPPNGWQPPSTLDPQIHNAFQALSDPDATTDQRVAAIAPNAADRAEVAAGIAADRKYSGKVDFTIAGWRAQDANTVSLLYSLQTAGGPSTPWPSTATALKAADGHWYAAAQYQCGLVGLAGSGCQTSSQLPQGIAGPGTPLNVTPSTASVVATSP
jgi:hypothetical protein